MYSNFLTDISIPLAITGALIGMASILSINVIVYKWAKGKALKNNPALSAIEVYKDTRLGTAKGYFHTKNLKQVRRINLCVGFPNCLLG
jgi:hypothetical protein